MYRSATANAPNLSSGNFFNRLILPHNKTEWKFLEKPEKRMKLYFAIQNVSIQTSRITNLCPRRNIGLNDQSEIIFHLPENTFLHMHFMN